MDAAEIIKSNYGKNPSKKQLEYCLWLNKSKLEHYQKFPLFKPSSPKHTAQINKYKELVELANTMLREKVKEEKVS